MEHSLWNAYWLLFELEDSGLPEELLRYNIPHQGMKTLTTASGTIGVCWHLDTHLSLLMCLCWSQMGHPLPTQNTTAMTYGTPSA